MNRDKQIEEMAKAMCVDGMPNGNCDLTDAPCDLECVYGYCAERLYDKGYRKHTDRFLLKENGELIPLLPKQSEGEWEEPHFVIEIIPLSDENYWNKLNEKKDEANNPYRCSVCKERTKTKTKYCPHCGAKMKNI